jgi:hypothetical protein
MMDEEKKIMGRASRARALLSVETGCPDRKRQNSSPQQTGDCHTPWFCLVPKSVFALLLSAIFLFSSPSPLRAGWLQLSNTSLGANAGVVAELGQVGYVSNCPPDGINDFFYPWADIYIVPMGSTALTDVSNAEGIPNTLQYIIIDEGPRLHRSGRVSHQRRLCGDH